MDGMEGATYGSPYNTWFWTKKQRARHLADSAPDQLALPSDGHSAEHGARIEYVLANAGSQASGPKDSDVGGWAVKSVKLGMLGRHPTLGCSLSDHLGVHVTPIRGEGGCRMSDEGSVVNDVDEERILDEI